MKPAWSWQFDADKLVTVPLVQLPSPITREWAWGDATGAGVKIAVIDSGIDESHPAVGPIAGGVTIERDPDDEDKAGAVDGDYGDPIGHGTACAGIIRMAAPRAELYAVKVLGNRSNGTAVAFAEGLRWAIENGMHIANLSLGTGKREYLGLFHDLTDQAYFKGMMIICAVNNVPLTTYPSTHASVFSVAAHTGKDPFGFDYNPEPPVEFGAPGIDVEVPWTGGATLTATGNSFAAPHITGLVARILSKHPGLTPFQMKTVLHAIANNSCPDRGPSGR